MDAPNEARAGANGSMVGRVAGYVWSWMPGIVRWYFTPSRRPRDLVEEQWNFAATLPTEHPVLLGGTLKDALQHCKEVRKFLVVYLHSSIHQDAQTFLEKVFCNEAVVSLLNRNFVVWAGDVSSPGAYYTALTLSIDGFPSIGVYSPYAFIPRTHAAFMSAGGRPFDFYKFADICNSVDPDQVLGMLTGVLEQYTPWISAVERVAREAVANRQLMEDQDAAYLEAVRADEELARQEEVREIEERIQRERAEEEALAESLRQEEEALAERHRLEESLRQEEMAAAALERERQKAAQRLASEPAADHPDAVQITFRAVDSSRATRRFYQDDTVKTLYDFVRTIESTPADFTLVVPFPRRSLSDLDSKLGDLNINKAILNIEPQ